MTQYYLLNNEAAPEYFDPVYYEKNHLAHYEYDNNRIYAVNNDEGFFNYLGDYEAFSLRYGPSAEKNASLFD